MILFTVKAIKFLLLFALMSGGFFLFRKQISRKKLVCFEIAMVIFAILANFAAGYLPPLTEQVTLTALGEKREEAEQEEIFLSGYKVDGKTFSSGKYLKIEEGHWFWSGENYCWRIETDPRQPEGVTRTVVFRIPVGWNRTLRFRGDVHRGMVQISTGEKTWVADTYAEKASTISEEIGRSPTRLLILDQIRILILYAVVLFGLAGLAGLAIKKEKSIIDFNKRHDGVFVFFLIAALQFVFAVKYSGIDCFWYDELVEMGWSVNANSLLDAVYVGAAPLPIFRILFHPWYSLAPYGERWLLIPFEIATSVGIFFVGMCGKEWRNVRVGIFSALFAAVSGNILVQCSYEIRSYSFYFASSAVLLYLYLRGWRIQKPTSKIWLSVAMVFFAGMHFHAVIFCIALFIVDVIAYFYCHVKGRSILPYIVSAISYIPIAFIILKRGFKNRYDYISNNFQSPPSFQSLSDLFSYFSGEINVIKILFVVGISFVLGTIVCRITKQRQETLYLCFPMFLIALIISFFMIYGNLINPKASLWMNRYFCDLLPCFYIICGLGLDKIAEFIDECNGGKIFTSRMVIIFTCLMIIPSSIFQMIKSGSTVRESWRQAADWIYSQSDYIYDENTLIVASAEKTAAFAWNEYYISQQGRRERLNVLNQGSVSRDKVLQYEYVFHKEINHLPLSRRIRNVLDEYYEPINNTEYGVTLYKKK